MTAPTALEHGPLGGWTDEHRVSLTRSQAVAYAAATNDANVHYANSLLAPPVYAVALAVPAWADAMERTFHADPYTLGSVHGEQHLTVVRPLTVESPLRVRASVVGVHPKSTGTLVVGRAEARDETGLVTDQVFVNFFRGVRVDRSSGELPPTHQLASDVRSSTPLVRVRYPVDLDQGVRYAYASGDMGIYHLDDAAARQLGFPRKIVHGVCTMALAGRAVIHAVCADDPRQLRRLAVRFSAPLLPGQDVVTSIWSLEAGRVAFEMTDSAGTVVVTNGLAEVDA